MQMMGVTVDFQENIKTEQSGGEEKNGCENSRKMKKAN